LIGRVFLRTDTTGGIKDALTELPGVSDIT
jgi:hypothetical protein